MSTTNFVTSGFERRVAASRITTLRPELRSGSCIPAGKLAPDRRMSACCGCEAIDRHFAASRAEKELGTYLRRGPTGTARVILSALQGLPGPVESVLDIGAGRAPTIDSAAV